MLERLDASIKEALLGGDKQRTEVLRAFKGAIQMAAKDNGTTLEDEFLPTLRKQIKQRGDSAEAYKQGGAAELEAKERAEAVMLEEFLPEQMSSDALIELVQAEVKASGLELEQKNFGALIGKISAKAGDQASKGDIAAALKSLMS